MLASASTKAAAITTLILNRFYIVPTHTFADASAQLLCISHTLGSFEPIAVQLKRDVIEAKNKREKKKKFSQLRKYYGAALYVSHVQSIEAAFNISTVCILLFLT